MTPDRVRPEKTIPRIGPLALPSPSPSASPEGCDPDTVVGTCPGTLTFTYGFTANASPRHGGAQSKKLGLAFAVYVTRRLFVEVDNDNMVSTKTARAPRVTGFGDTTVYAGYDALLEGPGRPSITLIYGIKASTASSAKGLGSGEMDHTILSAIGKTFGFQNRSYAEFDVGDYIAGRSSANGFDHFPFAAGIFERKLDDKKRYKLHMEVGGDFATSESNAGMYSLNYLQTTLSPNLAIRTGVRIGLTPNVSRAGLYVALKFSGRIK